MKLTNIGNSNYLQVSKIVVIADNDTNPIRRLISEAKERGKYIDTTRGKKTLSVIVTDSGQVIASSVDRRTIAKRIEEGY